MKYFLTLAIALFISQEAFSQYDFFKIAAGGVAALPIGVKGSRADFGYGGEAIFFKELNKGYQVGGSIGYTQYSVDDELDEVGFDDIQYLPIAIKGAKAIGELGFGAAFDIGYAIGLNDGNNGGFLYEPKIYFETSRFISSLGYRGILQESQNLHAIQFGFAVKLFDFSPDL